MLASLRPGCSVASSLDTWIYSHIWVRGNSTQMDRWNPRSVMTGCLASVTLVVRLQFGARLLHAELVGSGSWLDLGGRVSGSLLGSPEDFKSSTCYILYILKNSPNERLCSFPNTLNSAFPSFSIPFTHPSIIAGVRASSTASAISPIVQSIIRDYGTYSSLIGTYQ